MVDVWVGGLAENAASQHFMQLTAGKLIGLEVNDPAPAGHRPGDGQATKEPDMLKVTAPTKPASRTTRVKFGRP